MDGTWDDASVFLPADASVSNQPKPPPPPATGPSSRPGPSQRAPRCPLPCRVPAGSPSKHDNPTPPAPPHHRNQPYPNQIESRSPISPPNPLLRSAAMDDDDDVSPDASPSPASSPGGPPSAALPVADPVTVASAPPGGGYPVALPIHRTAASLYATASSGGGGGGGGREDAWSEGATSALIDAWGERFVALGRGSLRHPQWQEVADAVSSRDGYSKAPKSDVQCKNRIDTLKKKYKVERTKPVSSWQFFDRLDFLLAPTYGSKPGSGGGGGGGGHNSSSRSPVPPALRVSFPQRSRTPLMPAAASAPKRRPPSPEPSVSSESSDGFPPEPALLAANGKRRRTDEGHVDGSSSGDRTQGLRDLAQAIRRFGEAYERVEAAKLEQAAETERRCIDFARELESQRAQFFLNAQMELTQAKNHTSSRTAAIPAGATTVGGSSRRMSMATDASGSSNHHSRYRISHGDRARHAPRPHYQQYHENNHAAAAAAASEGEQSDDNEEDEEEESQ